MCLVCRGWLTGYLAGVDGLRREDWSEVFIQGRFSPWMKGQRTNTVRLRHKRKVGRHEEVVSQFLRAQPHLHQATTFNLIYLCQNSKHARITAGSRIS